MKKIIKASKTRSTDKKFPRGLNRNNTLYTLTLKMTTAQVVETSVTVNNCPIQDYVHSDDHIPPTFETTPGFQPFTVVTVS